MNDLQIVDMRRYPSNQSFEVIYQTVNDDDCYSATAMSQLLQRFTPQQFGRITLDHPLVIAEGNHRYRMCNVGSGQLYFYKINQ